MSQSTDLSQAELQKMLKNNQNYRELAWHMNDHGTGKGTLKMKKKAGLFTHAKHACCVCLTTLQLLLV
jgi:hypothetical protein